MLKFKLKAVLAVFVLLHGAADCEHKIVDLSHTLNSETHRWPTEKEFELIIKANSSYGNSWYASNEISLSEHTGTHLDSPVHFAMREGIWHSATIPVERLVAPVSLIDMEEKAKSDRDYLVTAEDITSWEETYGTIPEGAIVLFDFGWAPYWNSFEDVFGSTSNDTTTFHFPGVGMDAARILADRGIYGVGTDCPSVDYGPSQTYPVHVFLLEKNIYFLENVGEMSELPAGGKGVTLVVGSLKIDGGSGSPARLIAMFDDSLVTSSATLHLNVLPVALLLILSAML